MASVVASHTCAFRMRVICSGLVIVFVFPAKRSSATTYLVSDKTNLQNKANAATPGDTIIVANGTYDWGQVTITNNNGSSSSAWIVIKAQNFRGVTFNGSTSLRFKGTRMMIDGFRFADGNAGTNAVISFRSSSSNLSNYCRITNIIIDNYNTYSADSSVENEWVGIYGTNNRVDHCTFINKYNARATVVVWYSSTTYPNPAVSTYHRIDSNYFRGRSYQGDNGGETIRIGDSNSSRTDGLNIIEYNLFENCTQEEPEIISNKSDFNTYRYNTFKNCKGGLTLRHGRYCSVYSNFFIVDDPGVTEAYGIRAIDKGHKIFNNYIEAVNGNMSGGSTQLRAPINLYNGLSTDTTNAAAASGYFAADSCIVAFNTIVNAKGGGGIVLGGTGGGTIQPQGIILANNLVKMASGSALYKNSSNTSLTFSSEGNIYDAPSGLGTSAAGWNNAALSFGAKYNGILAAPILVQDVAVNSANYASLLQSSDARSVSRSGIFDVGAEEINGTGTVISHPLDSNLVGAGKPVNAILPVTLLNFSALVKDQNVELNWSVATENNVDRYEIEWNNGATSKKAGEVPASGRKNYNYRHLSPTSGNNYYRLRIVDKDGRFSYSSWKYVHLRSNQGVIVFPNPAKDVLAIKFNKTVKSFRLLLYNMIGKVVFQANVVGNNFSFPVSAFQPGNYILQVREEEKLMNNYPIIISP